MTDSPTDGPWPKDGFVVTLHLTVAGVDRSAQLYSRVFGGTVVRTGHLSIVRTGNTWLILNVGGGPTDDKPSIWLRPPRQLHDVSSLINLRVADVAEARPSRRSASCRNWSTRAADGPSGRSSRTSSRARASWSSTVSPTGSTPGGSPCRLAWRLSMLVDRS